MLELLNPIQGNLSIQNLYQGKQEQHSTEGNTTSGSWNLSLLSEEQLFAWLQIWYWIHSIANWLK